MNVMNIMYVYIVSTFTRYTYKNIAGILDYSNIIDTYIHSRITVKLVKMCNICIYVLPSNLISIVYYILHFIT